MPATLPTAPWEEDPARLTENLLSQLKRDGFQPSGPALFDSAISPLSSPISNQTQTASALTNFLISNRRESYLNHVSLPFSSSQRSELLVSLGSGTDLFAQDLLKKISSQVKEDSFHSSSSLAKLVCSQSQGRRKSSASSGAASSSCAPGPSSYSRSWITLILAPLLPGSVLPLSVGVVLVSVLWVAGVRLLRDPSGVFGSRSHIPV